MTLLQYRRFVPALHIEVDKTMPGYSNHVSIPCYAEPKRKAFRQRRRRRAALLILAVVGLLLLCGGLLLAKASGALHLPSSGMSEQPGTHQTDVGEEHAGAAGTAPGKGAADTEWCLLLINEENPLPMNYQIPELTQLRNGHAVDSRIYPALQRMMDDARAEGLQPLICSSFRTRDKQEELFAGKVAAFLEQGYSRQESEEKAAVWVARPGASEHQTGLAVDIVDMNYQLLDEKQEETPVQRWLMGHCAEYGFILRYPPDKSELTGVGHEPWHYRYVGEAAAREIMERHICLEEY